MVQRSRKEMVSAVVAFRNEARTLSDCLDSLAKQTHKPMEIILVDDGSTDGSTEIALAFTKRCSYAKYFRMEHKRDSHNLPRIFGVQRAKGSIIFITEGDGKYNAEFVSLCVPHLKEKDVGGVMCRINVWDPQTFVSKYRDVLLSKRWDNQEFVRAGAQKGRYSPWIFYRKTYMTLGGYDERVGYGADIDFARRMLASGRQIVYEPRAIMWHRWKEFPLEVIRNNWIVGRLDYSTNRKNLRIVVKNAYFLLPPIFFVIGFFSFFGWWLLGLHVAPLIVRSILTFLKHPGHRYRAYTLTAPLIQCLHHGSLAVGFFSRPLTNVFLRVHKSGSLQI